MSVLSDRAILDHMPDLAEPLQPQCVQPSSYDVHLGGALRRMPYGVTIDPEADQSALLDTVPIRTDGRWLIGQNVLHLGVTLERVTVPDGMVAHVHGLSSLGRLGLIVHCTAGLIDAGWSAPVTLEIVSLGGHFLLRPGMRIAQISWHMLTSACDALYSGRYVGSGVEPVASRAHLDRGVLA